MKLLKNFKTSINTQKIYLEVKIELFLACAFLKIIESCKYEVATGESKKKFKSK